MRVVHKYSQQFGRHNTIVGYWLSFSLFYSVECNNARHEQILPKSIINCMCSTNKAHTQTRSRSHKHKHTLCQSAGSQDQARVLKHVR